jgi:hypothetical protein
MHQPYQEILKHPHDFVVRYRFFTLQEGGKELPPFQGARLNFRYADKALNVGGDSIIFPEFEDEARNVILTQYAPVPASGTARMWIVNPERRPIHQQRINIGTKGYLMGVKPIAECEVIEIVGLPSNPTKNKRGIHE